MKNKNIFSNFLKSNQLVIAILIIAAGVQMLVGVSVWKVIGVTIFIGALLWVGWKTNLKVISSGVIVLILVVWVWHLVKIEFAAQGPATEKMKPYAQLEADVKIAQTIAPNMLRTREALIFAKQTMQNKYGTMVNEALQKDDFEEVKKLCAEQRKKTEDFDLEIKKIDEQIVKDSILISQPPQWSVEKIGKNKVQVHFVPNCTINTGLKIKPGDTYKFYQVTAPFDVAGSRKPFYTITGSIDFEAKKSGEVYVYGCGYEGDVVIEVCS